MSDHLPYLAALELANTKAARAEWLMTCPLRVLDRVQDELRASLRAANFGDGVAALEAELAQLACRRLASGDLPQTIILNREMQRSKLREIIRRAGAHG